MASPHGQPEYLRKVDLLYAFCVDGLSDINDMLKRLNDAARYDGSLPAGVVAEVREAIWDRVDRHHGGTIGRPWYSSIGVAGPAQRRMT